MTKRLGNFFALLTAAVLFGTVASVAQTAPPAKLRQIKAMTSLPTMTMGMIFTMMGRELDKKQGIEIEWLSAGTASNIQVDAVVSGNALFATPGTSTALAAIREGADLRILASIANNQIVTVINNETLKKIGVSPTAPIADRIRALKGLTIGTNAVGATYYQVLRTYLKRYGLDPDKDVRLVGMADSSALISGIEQGRFDAITSASGVVEQSIAMKTGTLWFSGARGDIPGSEEAIVAVIIARGDTVDKDPELVKQFLAALDDSRKAVQNDHAAVGKMLKEKYFTKLDPAMWELVWGGATKAYPSDLSFSKKAYEFWLNEDPKGPDSYKNVDYKKIVYGPAQVQ